MSTKLDKMELDESTNYAVTELTADQYAAWKSAMINVGNSVVKGDLKEYGLPSTPDEVLAVLAVALDTQDDLRFVLDCRSVWFVYLKSITEERAHNALDFLCEVGTNSDILLYFRAMYRFGYPVIIDEEFDALEKLYVMAYDNMHWVMEHTYDHDLYTNVVNMAISMSIGKDVGKRVDPAKLTASLAKGAQFEELNSEKSTSIRPVESWEEVFEFINTVPDCDVMFSLKIDGINTKTLFADDGAGLELALSRGRASDSFDYTEALKAEFKIRGINEGLLKGKLTGESFVTITGVRELNAKYPEKKYKTPKSTGAAMLRSPHNFEECDMKYLRTLFFNYNNERSDVAYQKMLDAGLEVPPYMVVKRDEIPVAAEEFRAWLFDTILEKFKQEGDAAMLPSDGVVLELLAPIDTTRKDKYSDANIAIKFGSWAGASYTSTVVDILIEQRRTEASVVLVIEPVVTRDYNTATRVAGISTSILINDNVRVGSRIEFVRKSEAYNTYVRCLDEKTPS